MVFFAILIVAAAARTIKVGGDFGWTAATNPGSDKQIQASVGDFLLFDYFSIHDVQEMTGENCDFSSAILLANPTQSPFTLQLTAPGEYWYSCSSGDHCQRGQIVQVIVEETVAGEEAVAGEEQYTESDISMRQRMCIPSRCDMAALAPLLSAGSDQDKQMQTVGQACKDTTSAACKTLVQAMYGCQESKLADNADDYLVATMLQSLTDILEQDLGLDGGSTPDEILAIVLSDGDGLSEEERLDLGILTNRSAELDDAKAAVDHTRDFEDRIEESRCTEPTSVDGSPGVSVVTCWSAPISMYPGQVTDVIQTLKSPFPLDRPVAIVEMNTHVVDADLQIVSLRELYVHHVVGTLNFGAGAEDLRRPLQSFPAPYVRLHNPSQKPDYANFHLINSLGVSEEDRLPCIECACFEGFVTSDNGDAGGVTCCRDCESTLAPELKTYFVEYTTQYRDITDEDVPIRSLFLNAAAKGFEYDVPYMGKNQIHTTEKIARASYSSMYDDEEEVLQILRCEGHQHIGGLELSVVDVQTSESICSHVAIYGDGGKDEIGNEKDYLVDMTYNVFMPPRKLKADRKIRIISEYDASVRHTGVMGLVSVDYVGKRSDIYWSAKSFQAQPCESISAPGAVRVLHVVRDTAGASLFWMGPEGRCIDGLTFRVERFDTKTKAWLEVGRNLIDAMYKVDNVGGKFAVFAVSQDAESKRVEINVGPAKKANKKKKNNKKKKKHMKKTRV